MDRNHDDVELSDQELELVCGGLTRAWPGAWDQPEAWTPTGGAESADPAAAETASRQS